MKKYQVLVVLSALLVCLDQATKIYVHTHYLLGESTAVIPGFFSFTYVRNFGAAFGFLSESHPGFREVFFLAMPPVAMLIIFSLFRKVPETDRLQIYALSSIFGGAAGNYIDRVRFRYVIDFFDFHYKTWSYPAFNIADVAIVVGVGLLMLQMFFEGKKSKNKKSETLADNPS